MKFVDLDDNKYYYAVDFNQIINAGIYELFLKYGENRKIEWEDIQVDEEAIKSKVRQLKQIIFQVTQSCNLRCSYCSYSGSYFYQRKNSSKCLSFDTARKTIDYLRLFIDNRPEKQLTVGFYGGEPLLKFDTIEQIVDYSKKIFPNWILRFTLTTNGTLLDDRVIHFLVENDFNLMVSLDGSEKNHDSKRVFPNGGGSFCYIMENIKKIKAIDNDYYKDHVSFIITYSNDLPLDNVFDFFLTDDCVKMNTVQFSTVNHLDTDYYTQNRYDQMASNNSFNSILQMITDKKVRKLPLAPIEEDLLKQFVNLDKKSKRNRITYLAETCLFDNRLYIDADGVFHICEKMNDRFPFGDCHKGFDFLRMTQIAHEFMGLIKTKCHDCEVKFLCSRCYIHFAKNGVFEMTPDFCGMNKKKIKKLEKLIELKKKGVL